MGFSYTSLLGSINRKHLLIGKRLVRGCIFKGEGEFQSKIENKKSKLFYLYIIKPLALHPKVLLKQSITIKASPEKIFDYVSDLNNDHIWRPEVERMEVLDEGKVGTVVIEYITVYLLFHITTPVKILKIDRPFIYEIETMNNHPYWVHCRRTIEKVDNEHSKIMVELNFTLDNLKQVFPILPPKQVVFHWYNPRMKRYLKNLKKILEN